MSDGGLRLQDVAQVALVNALLARVPASLIRATIGFLNNIHGEYGPVLAKKLEQSWKSATARGGVAESPYWVQLRWALTKVGAWFSDISLSKTGDKPSEAALAEHAAGVIKVDPFRPLPNPYLAGRSSGRRSKTHCDAVSCPC
jgi:hypothetical protein